MPAPVMFWEGRCLIRTPIGVSALRRRVLLNPGWSSARHTVRQAFQSDPCMFFRQRTPSHACLCVYSLRQFPACTTFFDFHRSNKQAHPSLVARCSRAFVSTHGHSVGLRSPLVILITYCHLTQASRNRQKPTCDPRFVL